MNKTTIVQEQSSSTINTVAALAEKAAESDEGATFYCDGEAKRLAGMLGDKNECDTPPLLRDRL